MIAKNTKNQSFAGFLCPLLTEKQRLALNLFYVETSPWEKSPQPAPSAARRFMICSAAAKGLLEGYEKALGLAEKHQRSREKQAELEVLAKNYKNSPPRHYGGFSGKNGSPLKKVNKWH